MQHKLVQKLREERDRLTARFEEGELSGSEYAADMEAIATRIAHASLKPPSFRDEAKYYLWRGWRKYAVFGLFLLIALTAVMVRYEVATATSDGTAVAFRLDRWTGTVHWCHPGRCDPTQ
ncbi:hypothetical protein SAMN05216456_1307 [Devosia crocina]|uniref:Uncharacterized protein n=1 Tax=Devosia crocina TaxID=429728 RepID=A0A1I7N9G2_9HYPH|nr:hypothetical protein SAMN05216456_1307 [Devosia crocina]